MAGIAAAEGATFLRPETSVGAIRRRRRPAREREGAVAGAGVVGPAGELGSVVVAVAMVAATEAVIAYGLINS